MKQISYFHRCIRIVFIATITLNTANAVDLPDPDIFDGTLKESQTGKNQNPRNEEEKQPQQNEAKESSQEASEKQTGASENSKENKNKNNSNEPSEPLENENNNKESPNESSSQTAGNQKSGAESEQPTEGKEAPSQNTSSGVSANESAPESASSKEPIPVSIGDDSQTIKVEIPEDMVPETKETPPSSVYSGDVKTKDKNSRASGSNKPKSTNRGQSRGVDSGETLPTDL